MSRKKRLKDLIGQLEDFLESLPEDAPSLKLAKSSNDDLPAKPVEGGKSMTMEKKLLIEKMKKGLGK